LTEAKQMVLATIHQPSAELFEQFDDVLLLARGGRTVYFGPLGKDCRTLIDYFERNGARGLKDKENPAEWMIAQVTEERGGDWPDIWLKSDECKKLKEEIISLKDARKGKEVASDVDTQSKYAASLGTQLGALMGRTFRGQQRDMGYLIGKLALHITTVGLSLKLAEPETKCLSDPP
jgi:ATP-binding cassette subfamily G (WHITE) protein 2 (SNQ2)